MVEIAIKVHAVLGGLALLMGVIALIVRKGSKPHIVAGRTFFYSLLVSSFLAVIISLLPGHKNLYLMAIGIFTIYLIAIGFRTPRAFHSGDTSRIPDKVISGLMLLTGIGMITLPLMLSGNINIILAVFGGIGVALAIRDFRLYQRPEEFRKNWLKVHLGNMIGGLIAATTAFIVVNQFIPGLYGWLSPTVVGVAVIIFWRRRLKQQAVQNFEH